MNSRQEIRSLTGVRGIAAIWVVFYHFHHREVDATQWYWQYLERGYLAVDVFFVLSGFVLALSYGHLFINGFRLHDYSAFMVRRVARIYPLYILVVLAAVAGSLTPFESLWFKHEPSAIGYLSNILMVQTWGIAPSIVGPSWSLSVELAAYVLFPLLVTLILRTSLTFGAVVLAIGYGLLALAMRHGTHGGADNIPSLDITSPYSGIPLLRCIVQFTAGMFAYRLSTIPRVKLLLARGSTATCAVGMAMALLAFPGTDFAIALTFPLTVAALAVGHRGLSAVLATTGPFFLGEISYSLYMLHIQFLRVRGVGYRVLNGIFDPTIAALVAVMVTYLALLTISAWTHKGIEVRARRIIQNLASRPGQLAVERSEAAGRADLL